MSNAVLKPYQKRAKKFIKDNPYCGIFLDPGLGKTLITLSALEELAEEGRLRGHILVIAPKNVARTTWINELKKWGFDFRCKSLIVNERGKQLTKKAREELLTEALTAPPTMYFINRDLVTNLVDFYVDRSIKPRGRYRYPQGWIFKNIVCDELQSFKSHSAKRFLALRLVRPHADRFIGLTGTPTPKGLEDLWSELYLMDLGKRLGTTMTSFRRDYFIPSKFMYNRPVEYMPRPNAEQQVYRLISDIVISMKNTNLKLPSITYTDVKIQMNDDEYKTYKDFVKNRVIGFNKIEMLLRKAKSAKTPIMITYANPDDYTTVTDFFANNPNAPELTIYDGSPAMAKKWNDGQIPLMIHKPDQDCTSLNVNMSQIFNTEVDAAITAANGGVLAGRLAQMASGAIYLPSVDNKSKNRAYQVIHKHKLEYLEYVVTNSDSPILVAYYYKSDLDMITKHFAASKDLPDAVVFDGSPEMTEKWNNKEIPLMLMQPASTGAGANIQTGGHILVWYTLTTSLENYIQTVARLHRQGQTQPVIVMHLLTDKTIDTKMLQRIHKKDTSEKSLLSAIEVTIDDAAKEDDKND